jgi:hypothetical protein
LAATRTGEVDELLRRFYRAEMPDPWPAAPAVATVSPSQERQPRRLTFGRFFRAPTRLALAAAVALLVIGYLALQTWFPEPGPMSPFSTDTKDPFANTVKPHHPRDRAVNNVQPPGPSIQKPQGQNPPLLPYENLPFKK